MKKWLKKLRILFLMLLMHSVVAGQNTDADKLIQTLEKSKDSTERVSTLISLSKYYQSLNLDTAVALAHQSYELSKKIEYTEGEAWSLNLLGELYTKKDNYFFGLQTEINALKLFEKLNDQKGIAKTYYIIGNIYEQVENYQQALNNFIRSINKLESANDTLFMMNCYSSLGYNYYKLDNSDSAAKYAQLAYDMARIRKDNNERLPWTIALMGAVQDKLGNPAIAMAYYYEALMKGNESNQQSLFPYIYQVMAELYKRTTLIDSALLYGEKALEASKKINFSKGIADASIFLANLYADIDQAKALTYFKLSEQLRDSIFSVQQINQVQNIAYTEELRQHELEKERISAAEERKENIQYIGLTISVIILVILFLLFSHSIIANARLVEFFGIIALLVVFEFINLLIHPYLARFTNHSPSLMLGALVLLASLLVPVHHRLQKWINSKLVQKNKKIRLEAAKRIIAQHEQENMHNS